MTTKYLTLTGSMAVQVGDEYNPWNTGWRRLPYPYGWKVKEAPGAKFRRPVRSEKINQQLLKLI